VAQCIVIGPVCGFFVCVDVFVCLWVCYHDNSKLGLGKYYVGPFGPVGAVSQ